MSPTTPEPPQGGARLDPPDASAVPWLPETEGFVRRWVVVVGLRVSYVTGGSGAPLLLIHGIGSESSVWRWTMQSLAARFTVYAVDLPGCGESDKPAMDYTISMLAQTLGAFTKALGIERMHVIGHSLGGGVALQFHAYYPERVTRLVLVASGGLGRELHWILRINALPGAHSVLRVLSDPRSRMPSLGRAMERRRMQALRAAYDAQMPTVLHRLRDPRARAAFVAMARAVSDLHGQTISALPHLPQIDVPTLLIWGARDGILPMAHGLRAVDLLRHGHLHVLPRSSHRPQMDDPAAFNAAVLTFLEAKEWPPTERISLAPDAARLDILKRSPRRRRARMALAVAAVSLAAGAGWRYAPRSWRRAPMRPLRRLGAA
jgi:pimeloyl-ACP methyl ester carboxylesterase